MLHPHRNHRIHVALAAGLVLLMVLAACSANAGSSASQSAAATQSSAASQSVSQSAAASQSTAASGTQTVKLSGFKFDPETLTIAVGTKVIFQNQDGVTHTVTNGKDGQPETSPLFDQTVPDGASFEFTFTKAGTFNVTCKIHHTMNMTITVQ
jgi:plastocyanin